MADLASTLQGATHFVDAATIVCDAARALGCRAGVMLHGSSGPIRLVVDNFDVTDEHRLYTCSQAHWRDNFMLAQVRRSAVAIGSDAFDPGALAVASGAPTHALWIPIVGARGLLATVIFGTSEPPASRERELAMLATHLSVWCAHRGITADAAVALPPRQLAIAQRAAAGDTNDEIATALGISINTVKARLKQAFERLDVSNRVELANALRAHPPSEPLAAGVTHHATVAVTCASSAERTRRRAR